MSDTRPQSQPPDGNVSTPFSFEQDAEAVDIASPEAARYAGCVEALGHASAAQPRARLAYGSDRAQRLDVYAPPRACDLPVLLFFHGGAWINGHLGWLRFMAPLVTGLPAVFVAGTYRLAPRCHWPAQLEDVRQAWRTLYAQVHRFGGDPARIVVAGHSAGGHLAALLALQTEQFPVKACLPVSAPFDLRHGEVALASQEGRVYRYLFTRRSQDVEASPLLWVSPTAVPFHIVWGENDLKHVVSSGKSMINALLGVGAQASFHVKPRASHFDTHVALSNPTDPWYTRLKQVFA